MMVLTVKALREQLSQLPGEADDWPVILSQDAEGNGFSPVEEVTPGCYEAMSQSEGDWTDSMPRSQDNAVCLWPVR